MAKYTTTVALAATDTWQELAALANVIVTAEDGTSRFQVAVADAVGDLANQSGHKVGSSRPVVFSGLGTKKTFGKGPLGLKLNVTAYA